MRNVFVALAFIGLCGCVSSAEQQAAISARDDATCQSYGAKVGSDAYVHCRTAKAQQRDADAAMLNAAIVASPPPPMPTFQPAPAPLYTPQPLGTIEPGPTAGWPQY